MPSLPQLNKHQVQNKRKRSTENIQRSKTLQTSETRVSTIEQ